MFPVLTVMYVKLAKREEQDAIAEFGDAYRKYMVRVPAFIPRLGRLLDRSEATSRAPMTDRSR